MRQLKKILTLINTYVYVYGEGYGLAMILTLYFWDAFTKVFLGNTCEPFWGIKAIVINAIGVGLIIWSKHLKKD